MIKTSQYSILTSSKTLKHFYLNKLAAKSKFICDSSNKIPNKSTY